MSCSGTPVAVTFSYAQWQARYPEFQAVSEPSAQAFFAEAQLYFNPPASTLNQPQILVLLNMLTSHICSMATNPRNPALPGSPNAPSGRVSSATEGSVSAQFTNDYEPGTVQWYQQTRYGAAFWAATARFRGARYVSGKPRSLGLSQVPWLYPNAR